MREKDQLDLLIDSALATYAEPSSGMEKRLRDALAVKRLAGPSQSKKLAFSIRRIVPWAIGLAAAACVLLVLLVNNGQRPRKTQARITLSQPQPQRTMALPGIAASKPSARAFVRTSSSRAALHLASVPQTAALPKLDVFPTPQPLTPEEQALVAFVARAPEDERKAVVEAQQKMETPIGVAAIHIPPLESPDKGQP